MLRFGHVAVPVALIPARRDGSMGLRTLHRPCGNPIAETTVCPVHGEVTADELVKGWPVAPGQHVLLEDADLDALVPEAGHDLQALAYVDHDAVDELLIERSYYLRPAADNTGRRAYALVADALRDTGAAMVCRYVARKREHVCAIDAHTELTVLRLHNLAPVDDLVDPAPIHDTLATVTVTDGEQELASKLVRRLTTGLDEQLLVSAHRERVRALIESKLTGGQITVAETTETAAPQPAAGTLDLSAALRESIKAAPAKRPAGRRRAVRA